MRGPSGPAQLACLDRASSYASMLMELGARHHRECSWLFVTVTDYVSSVFVTGRV
jgi:hypothetical protein